MDYDVFEKPTADLFATSSKKSISNHMLTDITVVFVLPICKLKIVGGIDNSSYVAKNCYVGRYRNT